MASSKLIAAARRDKRVLTISRIDNAKPQAARYELPDAGLPSFYLTVTPSGHKSFVYRFKFNGQSRKLTIGSHPGMTLAMARQLAREAIGEIARGNDPCAAKAAGRRSEALSDVPRTFDQLVTKFIEMRPTSKSRPTARDVTWEAYARMLKRDALPQWKNRNIDTITTVDIEARLEAVASDRPILANRLASVFSKLFGWAAKKKYLAASPYINIEKPAPERARDRTLSRVELALILNAADRLDRTGKHIVHLLAMTAQRRNEIAHLRWDEVDLTERTLILSGNRTKNRREHRLPLGDAAMAILEDRNRDQSGHAHVFPRGRNPFNSFARLKEKLDALVTEANGGEVIPQWQFHDLRRTATSFMQELGISLSVTERILNHAGSLNRTAAAYHRHRFENEMREALQKWEQQIAVIRSGNVVEFRRNA
jgi:integrase